MPPTKNTRSHKRNARQIESEPTSPSQVNPSKIQSKSSTMADDMAAEIMRTLNELKNQNSSLHTQLIEQRKEFLDTIKESNAKSDELKQQIVDSHVCLKQEMTQLMETFKSDVKSEFDAINNKIIASNEQLQAKTDDITNTVSLLDARVTSIENDFDRLPHMNELKLIGIPASMNENLLVFFNSIAAIVGYDTSNPMFIPTMSRMMTRNKDNNTLTPTAVIILKFTAIHMKESFYNLYLRLLPNRKITTKDLGLPNETRIIFGENLTKHNMDIFVAASNSKRENKLQQVYTVNGLVNVKIQKGGKAYEIRHKHELEQLINSQTTASQTPVHEQHITSDNANK